MVKVTNNPRTQALEGRVHFLGETKEKNGFIKRVIVLDVPHQGSKYIDYLAIEFVKDGVNLLNEVCVGDEVKCDVTAASREWNGRWFTNICGLTLDVVKRNHADEPPKVDADDIVADDMPF